MISICLTKFVKNSPWGDVVADAFFKALSSYKNEISVEIIEGYPKKKYNIIILVGVRSIVKRNLDPKKILPFCDKLIDMGDSAMDPRKNHEDLYFYLRTRRVKARNPTSLNKNYLRLSFLFYSKYILFLSYISLCQLEL